MDTVTVRSQRPLTEKRPFIVGISPGNPYYYNEENLLKLFKFADQHSTEVKLFITDVIGEHNYRAVGSSNPERASRIKGNRLRNKCKSTMKNHPELEVTKFTHVDWRKEVEQAAGYQEKLSFIMELFQGHTEFRRDVLEVTESALKCLCQGRKQENKTGKQSSPRENKENDFPKSDHNANLEQGAGTRDEYDVIEGANYLLKELAFLLAIPSLYGGFQEYVFVYHRDWPVLEKLFNGHYDETCRPFMNFVILS